MRRCGKACSTRFSSNEPQTPANLSGLLIGFDQAREDIREALGALGNGYFATRAAALWAVTDDIYYPGTARDNIAVQD